MKLSHININIRRRNLKVVVELLQLLLMTLPLLYYIIIHINNKSFYHYTELVNKENITTADIYRQ